MSDNIDDRGAGAQPGPHAGQSAYPPPPPSLSYPPADAVVPAEQTVPPADAVYTGTSTPGLPTPPAYPAGQPGIPGYPAAGSAPAGYPTHGQPPAGYPASGYANPGAPNPSAPVPGYPAPGYPAGGYPGAPQTPQGYQGQQLAGYPAPGQPAYTAQGYPAPGYPVPGQPYPAYGAYPIAPPSGRRFWGIQFLYLIPFFGTIAVLIIALVQRSSTRNSPLPLVRENARWAANWALSFLLYIIVCYGVTIIVAIVASGARNDQLGAIAAIPVVLIYAVGIYCLVTIIIGTVKADRFVHRPFLALPFFRS